MISKIKMLGNPIVAFIAITLVSALVISLFDEAAKFIIVAVVAFFVADITSTIFSRGHRGILAVSLGNQSQKKGYGYIAFYLMIFVSTVVGGYIAQLLSSSILSDMESLANKFYVSLAISIVVVSYVEIKYYKRPSYANHPAHVSYQK